MSFVPLFASKPRRRAEWTPASIPDLLAYYPDDAAYRKQERTGAGATTPATALNDPVGTWLDASGHAYHATAKTDAARPLIGADGVPVFDGADDYLQVPGLSWSAGAHTVYAVASASASRSCGILTEASGSAKLGYGWSDAPLMRAVNADTFAATAAGTAPDGTRRRWAWRSPGLSGGLLPDWTARRDGSDAAGVALNFAMTTGSDSEIGRATSERFNAGLWALLVYARVLTESELSQLDTYYA